MLRPQNVANPPCKGERLLSGGRVSAETVSKSLGAGAGQKDGDKPHREEPRSPITRTKQPPVSYWVVWGKTLPPFLTYMASDLAPWHFLINPCTPVSLPWTPSLFVLPKGNPHFSASHPDQLVAERSWSQKLTLLAGPSPVFCRGWGDPSICRVGSGALGSPARSHLVGAEGAVLVHSDALGAALCAGQHAAVV